MKGRYYTEHINGIDLVILDANEKPKNHKSGYPAHIGKNSWSGSPKNLKPSKAPSSLFPISPWQAQGASTTPRRSKPYSTQLPIRSCWRSTGTPTSTTFPERVSFPTCMSTQPLINGSANPTETKATRIRSTPNSAGLNIPAPTATAYLPPSPSTLPMAASTLRAVKANGSANPPLSWEYQQSLIERTARKSVQKYVVERLRHRGKKIIYPDSCIIPARNIR